MNKTKIEWVKNPDGTQGYTWNPITGCLNGCEYCYARKLANGRLKQRYLDNDNISRVHVIRNGELDKAELDRALQDPFYPRFWPERLGDIPLKPSRGIFVCDMSDLFGIGIPEDWTERVLNIIEVNVQHRFYLLTKQPQNLIKWSPFPENCFVGVTATARIQFNMAAGALPQIEAKVKYISFEPLLGRIQHTTIPYLEALFKEGWLQWMIIGSQTKPTLYPEISWVEEIVEAADKAGVSVFEKNNLTPILGKNLRQEFPH